MSGVMTKIQFGKLLIQRANQKKAEDARALSQQGEHFRKLQAEKFHSMQARRAEDIKAQKVQASKAVEEVQARNLEIGIEVRTTVAESIAAANAEREELIRQARELIEFARNSPRSGGSSASESRLSVLALNQMSAAELRQLIAEWHEIRERFAVAETTRKKEIRDRVREEIGEQALLTSARLVHEERVVVAQERRATREKSAKAIVSEKEAFLESKKEQKKQISDFKAGAKNARSSLQSSRKSDADEQRIKKEGHLQRKNSNAARTARTKRGKRDGILEARSFRAPVKGPGSSNGTPPESPGGSMSSPSPMASPATGKR